MTSSTSLLARVDSHGSLGRARAWKVRFVASLVMWTLVAVGFGGVSWSHATSIANVNRELQDMRTMLDHVKSELRSTTGQNKRIPSDSVSGFSRHVFIAQTSDSPVEESCCDRISTLQVRVDSLQQDVDDISLQLDQKASLMLVMALQSDLNQKASVQNVSRVQQDLFELSRDLDQKANMVDVTALRSDLAQKANADSVTQMQAQVDTVQDAVLQKASVQNLSRLEVVVRGKASESDLARKANETTVEAVRAQLAAAEAQLRQKADGASTPRFSDLPVLPNLLQDTKHFQQVCHGEVGVETPWADAWSSPWVLDWSHSAAVDAASSTVEVVDMTSQASADRAGLWPLGALGVSQGGLVRDDFYGADVRALLLTVRTLPAAAHGAFGEISQGCPPYTSWFVGSFVTEVGVFANVLEHTGNIQVHLAYEGATVVIEGPASQGWQYLHNSSAGWGGCQGMQITGEGRMRVAMALPYQSFGNHSGVPVWSGFDHDFFFGNV